MNWVFDATTLLWLLPAVFGLGWVASRVDVRQWRRSEQEAPKAYFRGLNFLLNEQQDQAIDAFIEAVQHDPETSELHFALGNLFRRRGDYDRAVRVHEHLLARSDLNQADRHRAQHGLAMDFLKAGLLDRAEAALRKLDDTAYATEARLALLAIYERSRDWEQAIQIAKTLESGEQGSFSARRSHYHCELADVALQAGRTEIVTQALEQAIRLTPDSARGYIALSAVRATQGDNKAALSLLVQLAKRAPATLPLIAQRLVELGHVANDTAEVHQLLAAANQQQANIDVTLALSALQPENALTLHFSHLERHPSLATIANLIKVQALAQAGQTAADKTTTNVQNPLIGRAIDQAAAPLTRYRCAACGFEAKKYFWQCPGCQGWETFPPRRVEEL